MIAEDFPVSEGRRGNIQKLPRSAAPDVTIKTLAAMRLGEGDKDDKILRLLNLCKEHRQTSRVDLLRCQRHEANFIYI